MRIEDYEKINQFSTEMAQKDVNRVEHLKPLGLDSDERAQLLLYFKIGHLKKLKSLFNQLQNSTEACNRLEEIRNKATEMALNDVNSVEKQKSLGLDSDERLHLFLQRRQQHISFLFESITKIEKIDGPSVQSKEKFEYIPIMDVKKINKVVLIEIARQINGCYSNNFPDACFVMMRRFLETTTILLFLKNNDGSIITKTDGSGHYLSLGGLVKELLVYGKVTLTPRSKNFLSTAKEFGDIGAHNPLMNLNLTDLDNLQVKYRTLLGELLNYFI